MNSGAHEPTTRPARDEDFEFLWRLQCEAMRPNVERQFGPWDAAFQRRLFEENTDVAAQEIVRVDGEAIGCQCIREEGDALVLERLHLMPAWQGRGLGTKLLRAFVERASREGRAARLQVFRTNPARALYARIGFQTIDVGENHETMEWAPPS